MSLIKSLPLIVKTFREALKGFGKGVASDERTNQDLNIKVILGGIVILALAIWIVPVIPINLFGAFLIVIFGFFFATVSSRMVGLVGSSNNPVSGMTIATLLVATIALKATGSTGQGGMIAAIAIGGVICIVAAIAGDTSQDLKTGYILGATPKKQQIGEIIGVLASSLAIGGVLYLLHIGLRLHRASCSAGNPDENDRRRRYGRQSSLDLGGHWRIHRYCCGDPWNPGTSIRYRLIPSDSFKYPDDGRRHCKMDH